MNRRSEPRFDVYYRARIASLDDPHREIDGFLTDISGCGLRLVADQELPEDQLICVEVGQHLVLADVRRSIPRGNRFVIGAEKVHTLNLLTLPENMGRQDQIQALVDDYHLRIQFALESPGNSDTANTETPEGLPPQGMEYLAPVADITDGEVSPPAVAAPPPVPVEEMAAKLETAVEPAMEAVQTPDRPVQATATEEATPLAAVASAVLDQPEPGLAPAIPSNPAPALASPQEPNLPVEVDFGQLRIMLPQAQEIEPAAGAAESEAPVPQQLLLEAPAAPDGVEASTAPTGPIWQAPPPPEKKDPDWDMLRAVAFQQHFAPEPEPQPHSRRRIAALVAALVSVVALGALFFPVRRGAMSASPAATSTAETAKKAAAPPQPETAKPEISTPEPPNKETSKPESAKKEPPQKDLLAHVDSAAPPVTPTASGKTPDKTPGNTQSADLKLPPPAAAKPAASPAVASKPAPATPVPATPSAPPVLPAAAKPVPQPASSGQRVHSATVKTTADSWISACADGKMLAGNLLPAGNELEIEFAREAKVLIGNAGGVQMALEGKPLGPLGPDGTARFVELTPSGFQVLAMGTLHGCGK
jgi:cytoskeletal protein RodZ